jgi:acyl carrier protein
MGILAPAVQFVPLVKCWSRHRFQRRFVIDDHDLPWQRQLDSNVEGPAGEAMTRYEIRKAVIQALTSVAPEIDPQALRADTALRQELDLDSMDFLNFVIGLHDSLGVDVPEPDYPQLTTLNRVVDYLASRLTV